MCGTVTRGMSQYGDGAWERTGLQTVAMQLLGMWLLFDQLSRGFRQEEVNVHRLSGRTPLEEPIALCLPVYFHR